MEHSDAANPSDVTSQAWSQAKSTVGKVSPSDRPRRRS